MGELQRRIKKIYAIAFEYGPEGASEDDVFKIIGEMRQDFPLLDIADEDEFNRLSKWFERWLGNGNRRSLRRVCSLLRNCWRH